MDKKLASIGQLTTLFLLVSPFPAFVFCHKKALEKNEAIKQVSYRYLLVAFLNNTCWLAYSLKVDVMDLIIINLLGSIICGFFLALYIYVKILVGQSSGPLAMLGMSAPVIFAAYSDYLSKDWTGLLSVALAVGTYLVSLDSISVTLKTRDSKTVNMGIATACVVNGLVWALWAIYMRDMYVLTPNIAALFAASLQFKLYKWTTGELGNTHWLIKLLQRKCNVRGGKSLKVPKEEPERSYDDPESDPLDPEADKSRSRFGILKNKVPASSDKGHQEFEAGGRDDRR